MPADQIGSPPDGPKKHPMGWFVGLGVLLITLGVICGLIGVAMVAKRKQRHRIDERQPLPQRTNSVGTDEPQNQTSHVAGSTRP